MPPSWSPDAGADEWHARPGDCNCDGQLDFADINPFVLVITDPQGYSAAFPDCALITGDINGDGIVNIADINPFVAALVAAVGA